MREKIVPEILIEKVRLIHGNKYSYSFDDIINSKSKIKITCQTHGLFLQRLDHHLNGSGCPKCVGRGKTNTELIESFKLIYGDKYNYDLTQYKNAKTNIKITCPKHGFFEVHARNHLRGVECAKCERERLSSSQRKTTTEFLQKANETHCGYYDYSLVKYVNAKTKVQIICPKHGSFNQTPRQHIQGTGCPICKESKGERAIRLFLETNKINFISQYKFDNCKNIRPLPFDFYLPDFNICIEYQGEQHYINKNFFGGEVKLKYVQSNDNTKKQYCLQNNIKLYTIPYTNFKEIEILLQNYLSCG